MGLSQRVSLSLLASIVCFISVVIITCKVSAATELNVDQYFLNKGQIRDGMTDQSQLEGRSSRLKRSAWSLPDNTSARFELAYGVIVAPLQQADANQDTYLTYIMIYTFKLPTYQSMQELYQTLGKLKEYDDDDDYEREDDYFDLQFYEEQRANHERRKIYDHVEEHLNQ